MHPIREYARCVWGRERHDSASCSASCSPNHAESGRLIGPQGDPLRQEGPETCVQRGWAATKARNVAKAGRAVPLGAISSGCVPSSMVNQKRRVITPDPAAEVSTSCIYCAWSCGETAWMPGKGAVGHPTSVHQMGLPGSWCAMSCQVAAKEA